MPGLVLEVHAHSVLHRVLHSVLHSVLDSVLHSVLHSELRCGCALVHDYLVHVHVMLWGERGGVVACVA